MQNGIRKTLKNAVAKRLFGYGPVDDYSAMDNFQGPAKDIKLLGMYSGVAYRCISTIAEAVAGQYEPFPYTVDAQGKKTTINTHPLWALLADPNPDLTFYQLMEGSASFVEQFGEFFWYLVPGQKSGFNNGIKEIYLLRPDRVGIVIDKKTGDVLGYNYSVGTGSKTIKFVPEEIRHFKTLNPQNAYRGYAPLEAAVEYVVTEKEVSRFTRNYFANNAQLSGIIEVTGKVSRENWNKFVRQWRERYSGVDNAGKVALVRDSQVKWTPVTSTIQDMQLHDLKNTTVEQILMMFRIPKGLFGMEAGEGLGRASVETLEYIFAKWTIDNKLDRFDDFLESICQDYYKDIKCQVGHKNVIPSDKEFELKVYNEGVDRWITRKEIRDKDPDLQNNEQDGSDQLFVQSTFLPLNDPMTSDKHVQSKQPVASNNGPASGGDDVDGDDDNDNPDGDGADGDGSGEEQKSVKITLAKSKKKDLAESKEQFRRETDKRVADYTVKYREAFSKVLKKQKATVLSNITHLAGKSVTKNIGDNLFDSGEEDQNFQDELQPVLAELLAAQGAAAFQFSNAEGTYKLSEAIKEAVRKSTLRMSQNFDDQTLKDLQDSLTEGLLNGESIADLSARVADVYDAADGWRADRVARTEADSAANSATLDAYRQNPVVEYQQWYANPDACPFCEELDGTIVGLEENYVSLGDSVDVEGEDGVMQSMNVDYSDVGSPPLHPNCSCTIVPITAADL